MSESLPLTASSNGQQQLAAVLAELGSRSLELFDVGGVTFAADLRLDRPFSTVHRVQPIGTIPLTKLYVKIARPRSQAPGEHAFMASRVQHDFDITRRTYTALAPHQGLSVARPVACFPEHLTIVTEESPGETLLSLVETQARWWPNNVRLQRLEATMRRIGEWIRLFQESQPSTGEIALESVRDYLDVRLRKLVDSPLTPFSSSHRDAALQAFDARAGNVHPSTLARVLTHGDLAPGNILVRGTSVTVLDLAMSGTGTSLHDITHLYLQLEMLRGKPLFRPQTVRAMKQALLLGYGPVADPASPLFELMYLQHTVCHYVGLTSGQPGVVERTYNAWLAKRHLAWMGRFAA